MKDLKKKLELLEGSDSEESMGLKHEAKLKALMDLKEELSKLMGEGIGKKMKKVVVAAPDQEGLEKGLSKAKDLVQEMPELEEDELEGEEEELEEEIEEEPVGIVEKLQNEYNKESESEEDIDKKIAELQAKKKSFKPL